MVNKRKVNNKINENLGDVQNVQKKEETKKEYKNAKEFFIDFFEFFKTQLLKKQVIFFILILLVFGYFVITYISNLKNEDFLSQIQNIDENYVKPNVINIIAKEKLPNAIIIVLSGIAPYIYAPILGVLYGYQVAVHMIYAISTKGVNYNLIVMSIGAIIDFIGFALASSTGFTLCSYSTRRAKYSSKSEPNFLDIRKELYSITNNKKKIKELDNKKKEKAKKIEKYNVQTPYTFILTSFIISVIIILIGAFIFYI